MTTAAVLVVARALPGPRPCRRLVGPWLAAVVVGCLPIAWFLGLVVLDGARGGGFLNVRWR